MLETPAVAGGAPPAPPAPDAPSPPGEEAAPEHDISKAAAMATLSAATRLRFVFEKSNGYLCLVPLVPSRLRTPSSVRHLPRTVPAQSLVSEKNWSMIWK